MLINLVHVVFTKRKYVAVLEVSAFEGCRFKKKNVDFILKAGFTIAHNKHKLRVQKKFSNFFLIYSN